MLITIHAFSSVHDDHNGNSLPIGGRAAGSDTLTAAGESAAMVAGTMVARIATDTTVTVDAYPGHDPVLMPANSVEFFPAAADQTFTFAEPA